jgi:general secretion pathway protein I
MSAGLNLQSRLGRRGPRPAPACSAHHGARRGSSGAQGGFTLLEVLIAFAILSVAVVAVIQGFAQGLRLLKVAGDHQQAVLLADQKTREMVIPIEGRDQGKEGNFDWERVVTVVAAPDLTRTAVSAKWRVYQIDVKVSWGDKRGVEIVSLRTSAAPPTSELATSGPPRTLGVPVTPGMTTPTTPTPTPRRSR